MTLGGIIGAAAIVMAFGIVALLAYAVCRVGGAADHG